MPKTTQLSPEAAAQLRAWCSKGGRAGSHADKVRAAKLGAKARWKKYRAEKKK